MSHTRVNQNHEAEPNVHGLFDGRIQRQYVVWGLVWTLLIAASFAYNAFSVHRNVMHNAEAAALATINKDMSFRKWATSHGGVYVPPSERIPPNPYLHIPDRDVETTSGKVLTLMNPAYMLRDLQLNFPGDYGILTNITSLTPINPHNSADAWEVKALTQFEQNPEPVQAISHINGQAYLRLMQPFVVEPLCLKCHEAQGYKLRDVRGGISTAVPMAPYYEQRNSRWWQQGVTHSAVWLIGVFGLSIGRRRALKFEQERRSYLADLKESEVLYRSVTNNGQAFIWMSDVNEQHIFFNQPWLAFTGLTEANATTDWLGSIHPDDVAVCQQACRNAFIYHQAFQIAYRLKRHDGVYRWIYDEASPRYNAKGEFVGYIAHGLDITDLKEAESQIAALTNFDVLTQLPNRRLMMVQLAQALQQSALHQEHGAVLLIDLDNFKLLNDSLGHEMGDELLKQVTKRLQAILPKQATLARFGGDEFMMLLEQLDAVEYIAVEQVGVIVQQVLHVFDEAFQLDNTPYQTSASVGIMMFYGTNIDEEALLQHAEVAMYQAKEAGRNTARFFDPHMQDVVNARSQLEYELRQAVQQQHFVVYAQPQTDASGKVVGAELLLRWPHAKRGLVSPVEFIPLAEETGLILPLGEWVMRQACLTLAQWQSHAALAGLTLAVNVSARQFQQADFVDQIMRLLAETAAPAHCLKIELTESMFVSGFDVAMEKMHQLKHLGVKFSLDDFGTGYSSLSYLKRLPLDQLKIDQGFIRDLLLDENDRAIAQLIISLADNLNLEVIAEGVETQEQQALLAQMGCHRYQGYYFGRPQPLVQFEAALLAH
jgi:diguanylate cyclase (GGDEF)-like protein/PAS domain S-box-containing protein